MRVAIVTNIAWNLFNFRKELARDIINEGHEVILMAGKDLYVQKLTNLGYKFVQLSHLERTGRNPIKDIRLFFEFRKIFKKEKIDIAILYHAKPMVYGAFAAKSLKIPFIATITGLAGPFSGDRIFTKWIVTKMYRRSLSSSKKIIFQNEEDLEFLLKRNVVKKDLTDRVHGSGIDINLFECCESNGRRKEELVFLLFARLSYLKGVDLFVKAAAFVKKEFPHVKFLLAGPFDNDEHAVSKEEIKSWEDMGWIEYLGVSDHIQKEIKNADVIVYPSFYREGAPRALIESSAMCKPIITTNNVGCRDVVVDKYNGWLICSKDQDALEEAIIEMINTPEKERILMGKNGRARIEKYFSHNTVNKIYLDVISQQARE